MLNISEPKPEGNKQSSFSSFPIFELLFRSYFLLGMAASIISLVVWIGFLTGHSISGDSGLSPIIWHVHEMLFGFAATIAVGFILTAVQTWTGRASLSGMHVFFLIILWLLVRVLLWINSEVTIPFAILGQLLWWLYIIVSFTRIVVGSRNRRNYIFIPLLLTLATINIIILLADIFGNNALAIHLARTVVLLFTLLMSIIGGRVIPMFTVNGAKTLPIENIPVIEKLILPVGIAGTCTFSNTPIYIIAYHPSCIYGDFRFIAFD